MNNEKQHTVPKAYLKNFTKGRNGSFFQYLFKYDLVTPTSVADTCIERDFYDLTEKIAEDHNVPRIDVLEREAFRVYEQNIGKLNSLFESHALYLLRKDFEVLVDSYLIQKHRSTLFREMLGNESIFESLQDKILQQYKKEFSQFPTMGDIVSDEFIELIKKSNRENKNRPAETHLFGLIQSYMGRNEAMKTAAHQLLNYRVHVIECPPQEYFITSDNPGFTFVRAENGRLYPWNTKFPDFYCVVFPINSRQAVTFLDYRYLRMFEQLKRVTYHTLTPDGVRQINFSTYLYCDKMLYCEEKSYLEKVVAAFRQYNPERLKILNRSK